MELESTLASAFEGFGTHMLRVVAIGLGASLLFYLYRAFTSPVVVPRHRADRPDLVVAPGEVTDRRPLARSPLLGTAPPNVGALAGAGLLEDGERVYAAVPVRRVGTPLNGEGHLVATTTSVRWIQRRLRDHAEASHPVPLGCVGAQLQLGSERFLVVGGRFDRADQTRADQMFALLGALKEGATDPEARPAGPTHPEAGPAGATGPGTGPAAASSSEAAQRSRDDE